MKIILGPPGTGKTTSLLKILDKELKTVDPNKIAFVSFTRKGAYEARDRAIEKFGFKSGDLPYFKTLHSIGFNSGSASQLLAHEHYQEIGAHLGLEFSKYRSGTEDLPGGENTGDRMLFLMEFARNTCQELKGVWNRYSSNTSWHQLEQLDRTIAQYKKTRYMEDFTDLIQDFIDADQPLPVEVAIIDEAQDLSTIQWKMVQVAFQGIKRLYVAGDDDQAIYKWAGADVEHFLGLKGDVTILDQSYRLDKEILELAEQVSAQIGNRFTKKFKPKGDKGKVHKHNNPESIHIDRDTTWLMLARNRYLLSKYEEYLRREGHLYTKNNFSSVNPKHCEAIYGWEAYRQGKFVDEETQKKISKVLGKKMQSVKQEPWFDVFGFIPFDTREYYRSIMRRGHRLTAKPKISLNTIHSVKGGEADNVAIITDMSRKSHDHYLRESDDENRVFYVGMTRTKGDLHIIYPQTGRGYNGFN